MAYRQSILRARCYAQRRKEPRNGAGHLLATGGAETHRRLEGVIDPPLEA